MRKMMTVMTMVVMLASVASAAVPLITYNGATSTARGDGPWAIGVLIEIGSSPITINALGVQDTSNAGDGTVSDDGFFTSPIAVGLWTADGATLLASASVESSDPLIDSYRYTDSEEVELQANTQYILGATVGSGIEYFLDADSGTLPVVFAGNTGVTIIGGTYGNAGTAPTAPGGNQAARWCPANATFITPPPGPRKPSPAVGTIQMPLDIDLSWLGNVEADSFDVYLGTDPNAATTGTLIADDRTEPNLPNALLPALSESTTYYWQVVQNSSVPEFDALVGDSWSFTTVKPTELVLHWALDEGAAGATIVDSSGSANNAVPTGDPNYVPGVLPGGSDLALEFAADPEEVVLADANFLPTSGTQDNYTVTFFVKPDPSMPDQCHIAGFGQIDIRQERSIVNYAPGILGRGYGGVDVWTDAFFTAGKWQMITDTYDVYTRTRKVYKNGELIGEVTGVPADTVPTARLAEDATYNGLTGEFLGAIDDFRIYQGALTQAEIDALIPFATAPDPANGEIDVPASPTLTWKAPGAVTATSYSLKYSTTVDDNGDPNGVVTTVPGLTSPQASLSGLPLETTHYWTVDVVTASGTVAATEAWSFTTVPPRPYAPNPANGAVDVPITKVLGWSYDGTETEFDVYLGADAESLVLVSPDQTGTGFDATGELEYGPLVGSAKSYSWKVDVKDGVGGLVAEGPVWDFTTIVLTCDPPLLGDATGDCLVNLDDIAQMASDWLKCNIVPADACP